MSKKSDKTPFSSAPLRELLPYENKSLKAVMKVLSGKAHQKNIGKVTALFSVDGKERPMVFSGKIAKKIERDHGKMIPENLVINVHDWDLGVKSLDGNPDKISLIKKIRGSNNYLIVGATRNNGFYMVTHYEAVQKREGNRKLKSLLGRGDPLERSGVPPWAPKAFPIEPEKVSGDKNAELLADKNTKPGDDVKQ